MQPGQVPEQVVGPVTVAEVGAEAATDVVGVIHAGFGARERLDPPSTATDETVESVAASLAEHGGLLASAGGRAVGAMLFAPQTDRLGRMLGLRRVAVHPEAQRMGVAGGLVGAAEQVARRHGYDGVRLVARTDLPATVRFWEHLGYVEVDRAAPMLTMAKMLPVDKVAASADDARALGARLAAVLRAGDLVLLSGDLGAGKTTFTQGLGEGLKVRGAVTSPTFVISRVHPSLGEGPALVHVDAYRLGGIEELDDLDLDTSLEDAVTVVEWGEGVAEGLSEERLEVTLTRPRGDDPAATSPGEAAAPAGAEGERDTEEEPEAEPRHLRFTPVGSRWIGSRLREALA